MLTEREYRRLRRRIWLEKLLHKKLWFSRHKSKRMTQSVIKAIDFVFR
jgi:hypothetical protein